MAYAIGYPGKDIQDGMREPGQEIRDIGAVKYRFQRRKQDDVNARPPGRGNISSAKECHHPHEHWRGWEEELRRGRDKNGRSVCDRNQDFEGARIHNVKISACQHDKSDPKCGIVNGEIKVSQSIDRLVGIKRRV